MLVVVLVVAVVVGRRERERDLVTGAGQGATLHSS